MRAVAGSERGAGSASPRFLERLREKDPALWSSDRAVRKAIRGALGWVSAPEAMAAGLGSIRSFVSQARSAGIRDAVVFGMGAPLLACEVFRSCFPPRDGWPRLHVLDTISPGAALRLERALDLPRTLFIVSGKSGGTLETNCLLSHFEERARRLPGSPGARFAAITDPGTSLERRAREKGFRKIFLNPADIGEGYSALSYSGLVPAALAGIDVEKLLNRARAAMADAREGLSLGSALGDGARSGRGKLSFSSSPGLAGFGPWVEQLVAGSTGKQGRGMVPVLETPPESDSGDRVFVRLTLAGGPGGADEDRLRTLEESGAPVIRRNLSDAYDLGAQFYQWEVAAAAASALLGANPFDQPDVRGGREGTAALLSRLEAGPLPAEKASFRAGGFAAFSDPGLETLLGASPGSALPLGKVLAAHWGRLKRGDYGALLAFVEPSAKIMEMLDELRRRLARSVPAPMTLGIGPRYLHSTGQLHKGGDSNGAFLLLNETRPAPLPVPGEKFDFGTLQQAQARGDFEALRANGRRILRLDLERAEEGLRALLNAVAE